MNSAPVTRSMPGHSVFSIIFRAEGSIEGKLGTAAWTAAAIAAAVTLWVLLGMGGSPEPEHNEDHSQGFSRGDPVAVVGSTPSTIPI